MHSPGPLPDHLANEPFHVAAALDADVTRARLRASDLASPFHGVRTRSDVASSVTANALSYAAKMSDDQFFSHTTAARLLGLRMPENFRSTLLHVASTPPRRAPRDLGVRGHQLSDRQIVTSAPGLRVTDPIQTWLDCASILTVDELVVMGDGLLRRNSPLANLDQLADAIRQLSGRRGFGSLVLAFDLIRARTDSPRETLLRLLLQRAHFPEPEVNGPIVNEYGATIAHGDLVYRQYRTILEYDGGQHREDERQYNIDIDRLDDLMEERWRVIRINKSLMARRATLFAKVATALRAGGWRG